MHTYKFKIRYACPTLMKEKGSESRQEEKIMIDRRASKPWPKLHDHRPVLKTCTDSHH